MNLDTNDASFTEGLRAWLRRLDDEVVASFDAVLDCSPGYYPTTLYTLWVAELEHRGVGPAVSVAPNDKQVRLPVAHPLDFDWRFAPSSLALFLERIADLVVADSTVLYFGAPTLFSEAVPSGLGGHHVLIDANRPMVRAMGRRFGAESVIELRLGRDPVPAHLFGDIAILDPPWYPSDTSAFLSAASSSLRVGGTVLLSQPALATRPGVEREREDLFTELESLGLDLISVEPQALRYLTPHFEYLSIVAAQPGLTVRRDWRLGDLLRFRKAGAHMPGPFTASSEEPWCEVGFGPVRVKLRAAGGPDLVAVKRGLDRLTTVSRRDPNRARVGLWTSGNRVRKLESLDAIAELITLCDSSLANMKFSQKTVRLHAERLGLDRRVADRLFDLLLLEYQEHVAGGYGGAQ